MHRQISEIHAVWHRAQYTAKTQTMQWKNESDTTSWALHLQHTKTFFFHCGQFSTLSYHITSDSESANIMFSASSIELAHRSSPQDPVHLFISLQNEHIYTQVEDDNMIFNTP